MSEARGPWYLVTGLIIGLAIGLLTAWLLFPVEFINTTPATLRADFKNEYRYLIANAYAATSNLGRAQARLNLLNDINSTEALSKQAQTLESAGANSDSIRVLEGLSKILLSQSTAPVQGQFKSTQFPTLETTPNGNSLNPTDLTLNNATATFTPTQTNQSNQTPTAFLTATARPSRTPTATPGSPFVLARQSTFCRVNQPGLLQIWLTNSAGKPAAGIELTITWLSGQDIFFTGFKP